MIPWDLSLSLVRLFSRYSCTVLEDVMPEDLDQEVNYTDDVEQTAIPVMVNMKSNL